MIKKSIVTALLVTVTAVAAHAAPTAIDSKIAKYKSTSGVAGNLGSIGSDTLNNLMTYWAEGFKKKYPNVNTFDKDIERRSISKVSGVSATW